MFDHLAGTLPVNIDQHVFALRQAFLDLFARGRIEIAVHLRPFEKLSGIALCHEVFAGHEIVVHALRFAGAFWAGGGGDRQRQLTRIIVFFERHERVRDRCLART